MVMWRDNVALLEKWRAEHPDWGYRVDEVPRRPARHVMVRPDGTEEWHHDLGVLLDVVMAAEAKAGDGKPVS